MSTSRQLIAVSVLIEIDITQKTTRTNDPNSTSPVSSQNPKFDGYPSFSRRNRNTETWFPTQLRKVYKIMSK
jgi:hypothetical protein